MMQLIFQGGSEIVKLIIDRKNKKLEVATSKTNYQIVLRPWKDLFDRGKETMQERMTDKLDDGDFKKAIIMEMAKHGYAFKK